ncbi:endopolygalacturonase [Diaporthe helianthi]|uniref:endo-polygalacturonase n=1 Tax=Diaporthe helianthi TaxID=158607 RepID=A0A2P5HF99_DIAHE|nr:endopolygalacturonase [Diaporthe helianthi]
MLPVVILAALLPPLINAAPAEVKRADTCTFTSAAAVAKGKASCSTITLNNIAVPAGTTLDLTKLKTGTKVVFQGTTSVGYKEWEGPLISVSGTDITVTGASGHVIDGNGAKWWDGKGSNGGKTKPKFFYAHNLKRSTIKGLNVKNSPVQFMSINSASDLRVINVTYDNSAGDKGKLGHNTDAFDVSCSENIVISGAIVHNQDDCLAINSGTNITFTGGFCIGGHGLSVGSVGGRSNNVVQNVFIKNSKVIDSDNGVRVKTVSGATGKVSGVKFNNITLTNIAKYGVVIQQDYQNGSPTGKPTTGVPVTDLSITGVKGSVASSGTNVYLLCGKGSCSKWNWSGNGVTGGKKGSYCLNIPAGGPAC